MKKILPVIILTIIFNCQLVVAEDNVVNVNFQYPIDSYQYKNVMYIQGEIDNWTDDYRVFTYIDEQDVDIDYSYYDINNDNKKYNKTIDVTNYSDGKHILKIIIKDKDGNIKGLKQQEFNIKKYDTILSIDYPLTNYQYDSLLYFQGSIKTDSKNYSLKAYLDDIEVTDLIYYNQNEFFYKTIDVSEIDNGKHLLKVVALNNDTNEVLEQKEKEFTVSDKTFLTLDYPLENYNYKTQVYLQGTIKGQYKNLIKEVLIDDEVISSRLEEYSENASDSSIKFFTTIDTSKYNDGKHKITVRIRRNKKIVSSVSKTINMKKYNSISFIDYPLTTYLYKNVLYFQGWVMSESPNKKIVVKIDDKDITDFTTYVRDDVLETINGYGSKDINETPGIMGVVDTISLTDKEHEFQIILLDTLTGEVLTKTSKKFNVKKYDANINIEYPFDYLYKTNLYVQGYIDSNILESEVELVVDNEKIYNNVSRYERNDISNYKYGDSTTNKESGFFTTLDITDLKDGYHFLTVNVYSLGVARELVTTKTVKFKMKKYDGLLYLDSPVTSLFSTSIVLEGWEMSEVGDSYLKYYIDNIDVTNTLASETERYRRDDVLTAVKNYGDEEVNKTPGYKTTIDLSLLGEGNHEIEIKLYTKYGEEINSLTKNIFVFKNVHFGIDVSSHNKILDWNKIKNNGVDYAFIRAGVRGYGINSMGIDGYLRRDESFYSNVKNAKLNGIKVGAYIFSQAVSIQEAIQEANLVLDMVNDNGGKNTFSLPLVFDTEFSGCIDDYGNRCGRADNLSKQERTDIAKAFLETIKAAGYTPMIYGSKSFLNSNLDMEQLNGYDVWLAHYTVGGNTVNPLDYKSDYKGTYQVWQYTSSGSILGIEGNVDLDLFFKEY